MIPKSLNLPPLLTSMAVLTGLALIMAGALGALGFAALTVPQQGDIIDSYLWRVLRFTLWQAGLSAVLSVGLAIPVARAISRRQTFTGRTFLLRLFALPLALPALVVVLGIVEVWGRHGWVSDAIKLLELDIQMPSIYGLGGILLAHIFFNLPLAVRLMVLQLSRVSNENWRLSNQLNMQSADIFRFIEWPILRSALPGIFSLIFMLCIASFTVVLTMGGGPGATTIEVAIYQALRFDFDPARAVILSVMQLGMTGILLMLGARLRMAVGATQTMTRRVQRPDLTGLGGQIADTSVISTAALFIILPLSALILSGLTAPFAKLFLEPVVWQAILTSVFIGGIAALLCLSMAWSLIIGAHEAQKSSDSRVSNGVGWLGAFVIACETGGSLILVMSPIILGAGWFILLRQFGSVDDLSIVIVTLINALMALPYVLRILGPAHSGVVKSHDRLCQNLGLSGWQRWRIADWPVLRPTFGLAFAFAMALSLGDLGAVALFGSEDLTTLPLLILQRMGSYRTTDAAGLALILILFCLALITIAERSASPVSRRSAKGTVHAK